ncbi:MAG TPA: hypothetical protein VNF47_03455 [Streptosporangiaceae bacterium]|nr:hypothetical protein [Streptosporangiaceae bacterium]
MATFGSGHIERLPSGSFRVVVYAGKDPLTGRQLRHRKTVKTEQQAQIILGRLLEDAAAGKRPDTRVTVSELMAGANCAGCKVRKDTKTHQGRYLAIDEITVTVLGERWHYVRQELVRIGVELPASAYIFSHDLAGAAPWDPNWVTKKVAEVAVAAGVSMNIKSLRRYSASQLLTGGIDLRDTAARLGHGARPGSRPLPVGAVQSSRQSRNT